MIYLLSKNSNYTEYWNSILSDALVVESDEITKIQADDIVVISGSLYNSLEGIVANVIVLDNEPNFEKCMKFLQGGVKAYGNTYMHISHILSAVESVRDNKIWIYPDFMSAIIGLADIQVDNHLEKKLEPLTSREKDIAKLILNGLTNKEIAIELHISPSTIKTHTTHIYQKLSVTDRLSLFTYLK